LLKIEPPGFLTVYIFHMQNMPKQWSTLLDYSNISKEDQSRDPQAVIDVLEFYSNQGAADTRARRELFVWQCRAACLALDAYE
jgi:hypothetical protein